jgi:hypothetical protein
VAAGDLGSIQCQGLTFLQETMKIKSGRTHFSAAAGSGMTSSSTEGALLLCAACAVLLFDPVLLPEPLWACAGAAAAPTSAPEVVLLLDEVGLLSGLEPSTIAAEAAPSRSSAGTVPSLVLGVSASAGTGGVTSVSTLKWVSA